MRKILHTLVILLSIVTIQSFSSANTALAGVMDRINSPSVCALLIGDADVKTKDFIDILDDKLNSNIDNSKQKKIECGTNIQSKYQEYWFSKDFIEEQKLTKTDLHEFVKYSGYDRCLYLIVSAPSMEKTKLPSGWFTTSERTRASVEVKGFLVDKDKVIKTINITKNDDSMASELRAKRGAFEKCIKELSKEFQPFLFK